MARRIRARSPRRRLAGAPIIVVAGAAVLGIGSVYLVPILSHPNGGSAGQRDPGSDYPSSVTATGSDGRTRTLSAAGEDGGAIDLSSVRDGARVVVTGTGYDDGTGIYVALCARAADPSLRPTPCIGGAPEVSEGADAQSWAASAWINDAPGWRVFGASAWEEGGFTVRLTLARGDAGLDCAVTACAIYTRADHTAIGDRTQDLFLPVSFSS